MSRSEGNSRAPSQEMPQVSRCALPCGALVQLSERPNQIGRAVTIVNSCPVPLPRPDIQLVKCLTDSDLRQKVMLADTPGKENGWEMLNNRCGT